MQTFSKARVTGVAYLAQNVKNKVNGLSSTWRKRVINPHVVLLILSYDISGSYL